MAKRISTSIIALLAVQGAASAADLPSRKGPTPAPLIFSWEGVYLGTQVGYGLNTVSSREPTQSPATPEIGNPVSYSQNYSSRGPLTGFHVGYNKQYGSLVLGVEGDVDYAGQNTSKTLFNSLVSRSAGRHKPTYRTISAGRFAAVQATPTTAHSIMLRAAW